MKTMIKILPYAALTILATFASCKKDDDPKSPGTSTPQEQITTVVLTGFNQNDPGDQARQFSVKWEDLDGDGGNGPVIDSLLLDTGIEYHVTVLLLDKTKMPYDTISEEVEELKNIHQFFYTPESSLAGKMEIERLDYDDNNPPLPVGLEFRINTSTTSSFALPVTGSLNMVLSHYDGVPKTATPSPESDLDIYFPVRLK